MIVADVLTWFLLIVGSILVLNSYWLAAVSLGPHFVDACALKYRKPLAITLGGLVLAVPFGLLVVLLRQTHHAVANVIALCALGVPVVIGIAGAAGLAQKIGQGLASPKDETQSWRRVSRGGIVLTLTLLLPFIGWFILFPWTLISGLGAVALVWREQRKVDKQTDSPAGVPSSLCVAEGANPPG